LQWFNPLSSAEKTRLVDTNPELFGGVRRWETLTGSEIENIFYNEVIVKWWDSLDASKMGDFLYHLRDGMDSMEEVTKAEICTLYIKEHSKEEPYINKGLDYMIDLEQPLSVKKHIEVDGEFNYYSSNLITEKKEAIEFADYLLGNFEMSEFEKEHPKYKVDDELCWQLAGTQQKYTTVEMYEIWLNEPKITQPKVEVNSWDDVFRLIKLETRSDSLTEKIVETLKNNYTLTKKSKTSNGYKWEKNNK